MASLPGLKKYVVIPKPRRWCWRREVVYGQWVAVTGALTKGDGDLTDEMHVGVHLTMQPVTEVICVRRWSATRARQEVRRQLDERRSSL